MEVGDLGPSNEPRRICAGKAGRIFDLLVLAGAGEPERLRELNVPAQVGNRASGVPAAGKIPLVEDEPLDIRLAIKEEPPVACGDASQPKVAGDLVDLSAGAVDETDDEVVEDRRVRAPGRHHGEKEPAATGCATPMADVSFTKASVQLNDTPGLRYRDLELDDPSVHS